MRGDLDELDARVKALDVRMTAAHAAWDAVSRRATAQQAPGAADSHAEQLRALVEDLRGLRDAVHGELKVVDARLADLRRRVDEIGAGATAAPAGQGPPSPEEEERWAAFARDSDPGVRFSALTRLGKVRTERSVQVSIERLEDENVEVLWQAVRNLGQFKEREAAAEVAKLLDHPESVIRSIAYEALLRMGAPADTGFVATEASAKRADPAARLRRWATQ